MSNEVVAVENNKSVLMQEWEGAYKIATVLSKSKIIPKEFQNNIPDCLIAFNMANRMGADPLMVMQNLYIVYGKPSFSSQFMIATFNVCGRFETLQYEFSGKEGTDDWSCVAFAVDKRTKKELRGTKVSIATAKKEGWYAKNGSKWQTMPQQMLMYRAATWFIRAYAPEITMGLHTTDEQQDIIDISEMPMVEEIKENANKQILDIQTESPKIETVVNQKTTKQETPPPAAAIDEEPPF